MLKKSFTDKSLHDRKKIAIDASNVCVNGHHNNQRSKGFVYSGKSIMDNKDVYVIDSNHDIIINNHLKFRYLKFTISVRYFNKRHDLLQKFKSAADGLAKSWSNEGNQVTGRVASGVMKKFGVRLGQGDAEYFLSSSTKHNLIANNHHREMNIIANEHA